MKKRFGKLRRPLSVLLAVCMLLSSISVGLTVFAADVPDKQDVKASAKDYANVISTLSADMDFREEVDQLTQAQDKEALYGKLVELMKDQRIASYLDKFSYPSCPSGVQIRVTVTDTEDGLFSKMSHILYGLVYSIGTANNNGGPNTWLTDVAATIENDLRTRLSSDVYSSNRIELIVRRLLGTWDEGNTDTSTTNCFTFLTQPAPNKTYLKRYDTLADVPDKVWTQMAETICHVRGNRVSFIPLKYAWTFNWNDWSAVTYNDEEMRADHANLYGGMGQPDTTSKAALNAFNAVFTHDVLTKEVSEWTPAETKSVLDNGSAALAGIVGMDGSVGDHFFKQAGDTYAQDAFARANALYKEAESYGQQAYINHITKMNEAYGGDYAIQSEDLDPMEIALNGAVDLYDLLSDGQKTNVGSYKAIDDALRTKFFAAQTAIYTEEYAAMIAELAEALRNPFIKNTVTGNVVLDDDMEGTVKHVADLYLGLAKRQVTLNSGNHTTTSIYLSILAELYTSMGETDYRAYEAERVLGLVGCTGSGETASFEVNNNPLAYQYRDISEIPTSVEHTRTTYTYTYTDGAVANKESMTSADQIVTDLTAKTVFDLWAATLTVDFMSQDLSALDYAALKSVKDQTLKAIDGVSVYTKATLDHLLTPVTMAIAKDAWMPYVNASMAALFVKNANALYETYFGIDGSTLSDQEMETFKAKMTEAYANYSELDAPYTGQAEVIAAKEKLDALQGAFSGIIEAYNLKLYMDLANQMTPYMNADLTAARALTMQDLAPLHSLIKGVENRYGALTAEQKATAEVTEKERIRAILEAARQAAVNTPAWTETTVDYSGIPNATADKALDLISKLDELINGALVKSLLQVPDGQSFGDYAYGMFEQLVFTDDTINAIMKMLYPMVKDKLPVGEGLVAAVGLYVSPKALVDNAKIGNDYPYMRAELQRVANNSNDWNDVDWTKMKWIDVSSGTENPVHDAASFCKALGLMLKGVWPVLKSLLNNESVSVIGIPIVNGNKGYDNVVYPLLLQLGCKDATTPQALYDNRNDQYWYMPALLTPLFNRIKEMLQSPVSTVMEFLPTIGYLFSYNMLEEGLAELGSPLSGLGVDLVSIIRGAGIDLSDLNALLQGDLLSGLLGGLKLPLINTGEVAGIAKKTGNGYGTLKGKITLTAKKDEMAVYVLRYALDLVKANPDLINGLLADMDESVKGLVRQLLANDNDKILNTLFGVLYPKDIAAVDWNMKEWQFNPTETDYGDTTNAKAKKAVQQLDVILNVVMKQFLKMDLSKLMGDNLFTDENLNNLTMTIYRLLGSADLAILPQLLGMDVSPSAMADALQAYPEVAAVLRAAPSWDTVDLTGMKWISPASETSVSDQFAMALARLFKPFNPLLKVLLTGEDMVLLDGMITLKGAAGYSNAILPLLSALSCDALTEKEYTTLIADSGEESMLFSILKPVFDKVDTLLASPVGTLAEMLPNFAYFLDNGGLTKAFNALILPLTNITDEVLPLFADENGNVPTLFDFILNLVGDILPETVKPILEKIDFNNLDASIFPLIQSILGDLTIGETTLQIKLPDVDWGTLAGRGDRKTDGGMWGALAGRLAGEPTTYHVEADSGAVLMGVLNYVFAAVKENKDLLFGLLGGAESTDLMTLVKQLLTDVLANEPAAMSAAVINVLSIENPEDDDWNMADFVHDLAGKLYGGDLDQQRVRGAIVKADQMVEGAAKLFLPAGTENLGQLVQNSLYTNQMVTTLFKTVYSALGTEEIGSVMGTLGLNVTPADLANILTAEKYPAVNALLAGKTTWADVFAAAPGVDGGSETPVSPWDTVSWGVDDAQSFASALAAMFRPFSGVLQALLLKGGDFDFELAGYKVKSASGYKDAVLPLLGALGCTEEDGVLAADAYKAAAQSDPDALLVNILMPILNWVDRVCASPVDVLTKILPNFAYFLNNDGLTRSLKNLLKPITNIADQLMPLFKDESGNVPDSIDFVLDLVSKILVLPEGLDLKALLNDPKTNLIPLANSFLKDLTVGEATLNIQLPAIDWGKLAGCGEVKTSAEAPFFAKFTADAQYKYVEADQENALLVIMTYVCKALVENKDALLGLVGTLPEAIQPYVDTLLSNSPEDLAKAIVKVINTKDILDDDWDMTDFLWAVNAAAYTEGVNAETVAQAITRMDELIVNLVPALAQGQSLKDLVSTNLYTDSLMSTLVSAIYQAIGSDDVAAVFTTLGIQITPADMAAVWADYPQVASALTGKTSWAQVDLTSASWNVTDADSFAKALAAAFRPFNPILKALLLKGSDYKLAGIYEIKSANGYKDAVLPLLGALGCTDVLSADDFKNAVAGDPDQLLVSILKPVLGLVDRVCAAPLDTLAGILPNLAYFLDNKGLTRCLTNLVKPITNILDELLPLLQENGGSLDALNNLLSGLLPEGLDLNNLEGTIIPTLQKLLQAGIPVGETTLHITLPDFTWGAIAGHGTEKTSADAPFLAKLTGSKNYKYIEADKGDVVMAVMNYLVSAVQANKDQILSLLGGLITDETTLNMVTGLINKGLENDPEVIAGALIKLLMTTEPEDVDWGTLIWTLSEALYPEGVTSARMDEAAQTADKAIKNALSAFAGINLTALLGDQLYTNSNISALVSALYGAVGTAEIAPILALLKVDVSTKAVARGLAADYPSVAQTIQAADSWADVNLSGANWNVTDRSGFAKALAASLRPFDGLLNLMLAGKGQTLAIADAVPVHGANGYKNAVMPLLSALGCTNLLSADAYASAAKQDGDTLLTAIVEPVLALVERVADKPVQTLAEILPNFAYFMSNNGLSKALNALLLPITNVADPILSLVTEKSLLSFVLEVAGVDLPIDLDHITDSIVPLLNSVLGNLEINGQKLALELPSIDWAVLAGYGTLESVPTTGLNRVAANTADTTLAVLRYVAKILSYKENPKAIQALVGSLASSDLIDQIVKNVTTADADTLVTMIVDLLAPNGEGLEGKSWSYKEIGSIKTTEFTKNLTREDFAKALPMLDDLIPFKLDVLVSSNLYTKSMMGTLTSSLFGLLNPKTLGFDVLDILKKVGVDMTPSGIASQLTESKFQVLKTALAKADSWTDVDFTTLDWGFSDGSQDGFAGTLAALLRPLSGVLGALLNGTDLVLLDSIHIKGGTGYNNAIIPLLEALGCKNILSAAEYAAQAQKNPDSLILAIINPLLDRVDDLLKKPFSTLTELIPNLAYFLYNDGLGQLAANLLLPVTKLLEEVSPVYDIDLNLSALNGLDPIDLINSLDIGIQLPPIDWKTLASRGTPVTYMSEQVDANGNQITATKVAADQPAVLAVTLRYVLNTLGDRENINGIKELLTGVDPSGTASTIVGVVLALAAAYGPDTTIETIFSFLLNIGNDNNGNNNKPTPKPTPNPDGGDDVDTTEPNGSGDDYGSGSGTDDGWVSDGSGGSDGGQTEETTVEETTAEETTPPAENPLAPVDPGDEPAETEEKDNLPLIIGLSVGGAVLVIAIGVAVWLILRKKKNAAAVPATGKTNSEEEK